MRGGNEGQLLTINISRLSPWIEQPTWHKKQNMNAELLNVRS